MTEIVTPSLLLTGPQMDKIGPYAEDLTLHGSGSAITGVKYLTPCRPDTPIEELKRKYREDGVLWVFDKWRCVSRTCRPLTIKPGQRVAQPGPGQQSQGRVSELR